MGFQPKMETASLISKGTEVKETAISEPVQHDKMTVTEPVPDTIEFDIENKVNQEETDINQEREKGKRKRMEKSIAENVGDVPGKKNTEMDGTPKKKELATVKSKKVKGTPSMTTTDQKGNTLFHS